MIWAQARNKAAVQFKRKRKRIKRGDIWAQAKKKNNKIFERKRKRKTRRYSPGGSDRKMWLISPNLIIILPNVLVMRTWTVKVFHGMDTTGHNRTVWKPAKIREKKLIPPSVKLFSLIIYNVNIKIKLVFHVANTTYHVFHPYEHLQKGIKWIYSAKTETSLVHSLFYVQMKIHSLPSIRYNNSRLPSM